MYRHNDILDSIAFSIEIMSNLKTINSGLNGHMINRILHEWSFHMKVYETSLRILHEWSFHMKFMKLDEYEMTFRVRFSIYIIRLTVIVMV